MQESVPESLLHYLHIPVILRLAVNFEALNFVKTVQLQFNGAKIQYSISIKYCYTDLMVSEKQTSMIAEAWISGAVTQFSDSWSWFSGPVIATIQWSLKHSMEIRDFSAYGTCWNVPYGVCEE